MTSAEWKELDRIEAVNDWPGLRAFLRRKKRKKSQEAAARRAGLKRIEQRGKAGARSMVRGLCVKRADGRCEACRVFRAEEMDHFLGRSRSESVETCWMLCRTCHREKTLNDPSRTDWDTIFAAHCAKHNYAFKPRLTKNLPTAALKAGPPPDQSEGLSVGSLEHDK